MPNFVIHAGPHKTGSTYLQRCLEFNAPRLLERGILVPGEWNHSAANPSHDGLIRRLNSAGLAELDSKFEEWRRARLNTVVISSEDIAILPPEQLDMLRALIGPDQFVVVFYVRRWSELVTSGWQETVKQGSPLPFLEYVLHRVCNPEECSEINIEPGLNRLIDAFGRKAMRLVSYSNVLDAGLNLFRHFARNFLGVADLAPIAAERVNASLSAAETELIRELNRIDQASGAPVTSRMSVALHDMRDDIDIGPLLSVLNGFVRSVSLRENMPFAREILRRNRAALADCVVKPVPAIRFYNPIDTTALYVTPGYAVPAGFGDALHGLRDMLSRHM
ncbi:MAG: hypothetical protein WDN04_28550 [Rhodospirillales bacterium]